MTLYHEQIDRAVAALLDATETSSHTTLQQVVSDVFATCKRAIVSYAQTWNAKNSLFLRTIPPEIRVQCFRFLDFYHCVQVSHVSHQMRDDALSAPNLWSDIRTFQNIEFLSTVLARTKSVLYNLTCMAPLTDDEIEVLTPHADRLCTLSHPAGLPLALLQLEMNSIQEINIVPQDGISFHKTNLVVPSQWAASNAPCLWALRITAFSFFPMAIPNSFSNLILFSGDMSADSDASTLFQCCPNLRDLRLVNIVNTEVLPVGPVPETLKRLELGVRQGDLGQYLELYSEVPLEVVSANACHDASWVFQAFGRATARFHPQLLCTAEVQNNAVFLSSHDNTHEYLVSDMAPRQNVNWDSLLTQNLGCRISRLSISFMPFVELLARSLALRSLQCIRLVLDEYDEGHLAVLGSDIISNGQKCTTGLDVPALQEIFIYSRAWGRVAFILICNILLYWLEHRFHSLGFLQSISIEGFCGPYDSQEFLHRLAQDVFVEEIQIGI